MEQTAAEQRRHLEANGYLVLEQLADPDELPWLIEIYDRLFRERAGYAAGNHFDLAGDDDESPTPALPQILGPQRYAPGLIESRLHTNAEALVQRLLGPGARTHFAHAILKPARYGAPTPWHQDAAYWAPNRWHKAVSIWVPLTRATPQNGCMEFVAGSHLKDVVPHQSIGNNPRIHGLELTPQAHASMDPPVACPIPAGGATVHTPYTLHHTGPNVSDEPRRALILFGVLPGESREPPLAQPWMAEKQTARMAREAVHKADPG